MAKIKQSRHSDAVVVELKERDWVKVLEIPLSSDLTWLAGINMLRPVQFDRMDLGLLIYCLREHAITFKRLSERKAIERIADKMEKAMQLSPASQPVHPAASQDVPNDKQRALKLMRNLNQDSERRNQP